MYVILQGNVDYNTPLTAMQAMQQHE